MWRLSAGAKAGKLLLLVLEADAVLHLRGSGHRAA